MLNVKKLENGITSAKLTKAKLCSKVGMARSTLDAILNGADAKISTIEAISKELNLKISFLLDEDVMVEEYHAHGERGLAVKHIDLVDQRQAQITSSSEEDDIISLKQKIGELQTKLLEAQAKIISLMENK